MFDLSPLVNQLKEYNLNQALILSELKEINQKLTKLENYAINTKLR